MTEDTAELMAVANETQSVEATTPDDSVRVPEELFVGLQMALAGANPGIYYEDLELALIVVNAESDSAPVVATTMHPEQLGEVMTSIME